MFFVVGILAANDYDRFRAFLNKYGLYTVGLFLIALPSVHFLVPEGLVDKKMICGLLSIPALHFISVIVHGRVGRLFEILGYYTLPIYLMNTLAIGGFKAIYIVVAGSMTAFFGIYLLGAMFAGILAPILAYIVVNRVSPGVAKYLK